MAGIKTDYKYELYFGKDIVLSDDLIIHQPILRDIFEYNPPVPEGSNFSGAGEHAFYRMVSTLVSTPADYDVQLDAAGVRYEDVDELDFFFSLVHMYGLTPDVTYPILGELDLTKFVRLKDTDTERIIFRNENGMTFDKAFYTHVVGIIRDMFSLTANNTKWQSEASRQMHFEYERKRARRHHREKPILIPIISMLVNTPGYKYNREETLDLNIYFFYDCLKQVMHSSQVDHLMTGVYVGMVDTKKMNLEESLSMIRKDV